MSTTARAQWRDLGIEIDDQLEVQWHQDSARIEKTVWVVFTDHRDNTPFVTSDRTLLGTRPMTFLLDSGWIWPLIDGDVVTNIRKAR